MKYLIYLWTTKIKMGFDQWISNLVKVGTTGSKTNAFAPMIKLVVVVAVVFAGVIYYCDDVFIKHLFAVLFVIVVIIACVIYVLLAIKNPSCLQSEKFQIELKKLNLIQTKGGNVEINPVNITPPPNEQIGDKQL